MYPCDDYIFVYIGYQFLVSNLTKTMEWISDSEWRIKWTNSAHVRVLPKGEEQLG